MRNKPFHQGWGLRTGTLVLVGVLLWWEVLAYSDGQNRNPQPGFESGRPFLYTGKKLGVPILKVSIQINNGFIEQGRRFYQIVAHVNSLPFWGFLFRMNNYFTSTVEAETCFPVRYVKEVHQEGLLIEKKNYLQIITFDPYNKRVLVEKKGEKEKMEISLPAETYDPLSMFARYYLREELHPDQAIQMSIYDGVKLRQMVFHPRREKVRSEIYGETETICLESSTPFSTFGDREGTIRIWYTTDGKKTPILMELDLPMGDIKFELEDVKKGQE